MSLGDKNVSQSNWESMVNLGHTLNGWVVLVHEMALYELNGETGFAHASSAHHHQFVFS